MTPEDLTALLTCPSNIMETRQFIVLNRTQPAGRLVFTVTTESGKENVIYIEPSPRVQDLTKLATFCQLVQSTSLRVLISQNKLSILSLSPDGSYKQPVPKPEFFPIREGDIYLSGKTMPGASIKLSGTTQTSTADSQGYFFLHIGIAKKPDIEVLVSMGGFRDTAFTILVEDSQLGVLTRPSVLGMAVSSTSISGRTVSNATVTMKVGELEFSTVSDQHGQFILVCDPLTSEFVKLHINSVGYEPQQFDYEPEMRPSSLRVNELTYLGNLVDGFTEPYATVLVTVDGQKPKTVDADESGLFMVPLPAIKGKVSVTAGHKDFLNKTVEVVPKNAIFEYVVIDSTYNTETSVFVQVKLHDAAEPVTLTLTLPDGTIRQQVVQEKGTINYVVFENLALADLVGQASLKVESQFFDSFEQTFPIIETSVLAPPHIFSFDVGSTSIQGQVSATSGSVVLTVPTGPTYSIDIQADGRFTFILAEPITEGIHPFTFIVPGYPQAVYEFEPNPKPQEEVNP